VRVRPTLTALAAGAAVLLGAGALWHVERTEAQQQRRILPATEKSTPAPANAVVAENRRPGSPEWRIPDGDVRPRTVEGFADRVSGLQGENVRLYVATEAPSFRVVAYRLGHYGGVGAREVWASELLPAPVQPRCGFEAADKMVDCSNWSPATTVPIGADWTPGQYLFKLIPSEPGTSSYIPFVLRDDGRASDVLVVSDMTTLLAYNNWGGHGYYNGARVGSFDRPLDIGWGMSGIIGDTFDAGMMLESLGLDVSYTTNVDQHVRPELMRNHKVIVSGWHDEYYSEEMRNGLETARDSGVNIVFLGANAVFRKIQFQDSPVGPNRRVLQEPVLWRNPPIDRPESTLTGMIYECNGPDLQADMVIHDADAWMFEGTNVTAGQRWPGAVRQEYDRVHPDVPTPPSLQVLARSPIECGAGPSFSDMIYYTAPSGAGVFNAGTLHFETQLGPLCAPQDLRPEHWQCQLRQMMANVFRTFAKGPAGHEHPSRPNLHEVAHITSVHPVLRG
jgi:hypothetical protein